MPAPAKRKDSAKNNVRALVPINPASSQQPAADKAQLTIVASILALRNAGTLRKRRAKTMARSGERWPISAKRLARRGLSNDRKSVGQGKRGAGGVTHGG